MGVLTEAFKSLSTQAQAVMPKDVLAWSRQLDLQHEVELLHEEVITIARYLFKSRILLFVLVMYATYVVFKTLFGELQYVRRNQDVGYITEPKQTKAERARDVQRRRQRGDLPPVYPNGWYRVCESHKLKRGGVMQAHLLGEELAVFRTESGKVGIIEAYCAHLGANLAAGGRVVGESIQCPFHGWEYNSEGKCTKIPYSTSEKIPEQANLSKYETVEINDQILFWYDAEGRPPMWYPPEVPEITSKWRYHGITEHNVNAHIQEVPENAADVAHLHFLHGPPLINGVDLRQTQDKFQFLRHAWQASWAPCKEEDKKHLSVLNLVHSLTIFGMRIPPLDLHVEATQVGPGLVYLKWSSMFGEGIFVQSLTPMEPLMQRLTHCIYASATIPSLLAKFYLVGEAKQVERDVMVWNNKRYRSKPVLVKEDQLIAQHRRWYKQFYSENSPTYESILKKDMSW